MKISPLLASVVSLAGVDHAGVKYAKLALQTSFIVLFLVGTLFIQGCVYDENGNPVLPAPVLRLPTIVPPHNFVVHQQPVGGGYRPGCFPPPMFAPISSGGLFPYQPYHPACVPVGAGSYYQYQRQPQLIYIQAPPAGCFR